MEETAIEWATHTFNPWIGCTKVAPGCEHCYAEADMDKRRGRVKWGPAGTRSRTTDEYWRMPLKWNKTAAMYHAERIGPTARPRVFCASLADVFEDWQDLIVNAAGRPLGICPGCQKIEVMRAHCSSCSCRQDDLTMAHLRVELFKLIDATPWLDWLLVTKRPQNIRRFWSYLDGDTTGRLREFMDPGESQDVDPCWRRNVWLLTSISDQVTADKVIPELLKCRGLAPVLGVSAEPLLGPIDLRPHLGIGGSRFRAAPGDKPDGQPGLNWVILGGESGPDARPCNIAWLRSIRDQCTAAGVPVFVKQLGAVPYLDDSASTGAPIDLANLTRLPGAAMKDRKGGDPAEWPADLRVRQFPEAVK